MNRSLHVPDGRGSVSADKEKARTGNIKPKPLRHGGKVRRPQLAHRIRPNIVESRRPADWVVVPAGRNDAMEHLVKIVDEILVAVRHHDDVDPPTSVQVENGAASTFESVELQSPTGPVHYTLPVAIEETSSSSAVGKLLSPTGRPHRSIAKDRRDSGELLGVKIGNAYRFPDFQFDRGRRRIRPTVAYANVQLESREDPWGVLDWWFTPERALGGRKPADLASTDELTEEDVDRAIGVDRRGMI